MSLLLSTHPDQIHERFEQGIHVLVAAQHDPVCGCTSELIGHTARLVEEGERQAEIERKRRETEYERWRREEQARRAAKALKDSKKELLQIIDA